MVPRWGFGNAPFKKETEKKYYNALFQTVNYIYDYPLQFDVIITDEISLAKGLFNRIVKQDQWDWFTVNMYLDYPSEKECKKIINGLILLRTSIVANDNQQIEKTKKLLQNLEYQKYLDNFSNFNVNNNKNEYIYILSRREEKEVLKIGMTTRNVMQRCKEINSATGVLYPYSPRRVYKVKDAAMAEQLIHDALKKWRARDDREFFILPYKDACKIIDEVLEKQNLIYNIDSK